MSELKEIAAAMNNTATEELKSHIDELDLALSVAPKKARMPEHVFKEHFMTPLAKEKNGIAHMKYIEYAGGPYSEVDIIDNSGTVLYTCPPLYNRSNVDDNAKNLPLAQIAGTYELKKARMESEATNYMNEVVVGINNNVKIDESDASFKWSKIYSRYVEEEKNTSTVKNEAPVSTPTSTQDEDLESYIVYD